MTDTSSVSDDDLFAKLLRFFEQPPESSLEELKEDLRAIGVNPEEEIKWVRNVVAEHLSAAKRQRLLDAARERDSFVKKIQEMKRAATGSRGDILGKIMEIVSTAPANQVAHAQAFFSKLDRVTDSDLKSLLEDLEALQQLEERTQTS